MLGLMATNGSELIMDVRNGGSLGCSSHRLVKFSPEAYRFGEDELVESLLSCNFKVNRASWEMVSKDKGAEPI